MKLKRIWLSVPVLSMLLALPAIAAEEIQQPDLSDKNTQQTLTLLSEFDRPITEAKQLSQTPIEPELENPEEEEITVTGTRTPRPVRLSPSTVNVITDEEIDENLVQDLRDLFRYEPNVGVGNNRRYGIQDITIRGLGGNRVLIQTDGIRTPNQFTFGTPSIGRDYFEIETLQSAEVIRGNASALYGSDALGGVVTFRTIEPSDLLNRFGKRDSLSVLSTSFDSADRGFVFNGVTANRIGDLEFLLSYTRRDAQEATVPGNNDFVDDRGVGRNNYLGKFVYRLNQTSSLDFTAERFLNFDDFDVSPLTVRDLIGPMGFRGQDETIDYTTSRSRFSLSYNYDDPNSRSFLSGAKLQLYYQNAKVEEERTQDFVRTGSGVDRRRLRNLNNSFVDRIFGGGVQLQSNFNLGNVTNRLTYGIDVSTTRNERTRDGLEQRFNAAGNVFTSTNVIGADNFPVKDFPDSDTLRFGAYIQNEIEFGKTFTLIPGLRFDSYRLETSPDAIYARNPGAVAADFTSSAVSPSLGFVWQTTPELAIVGRYARGFRAPLYSEINAGFTNLTSPTFRYKTLSNPDLEPETSDGFELGLRGGFSQFNFSLTGFYNSYDNFIERLANVGQSFTIVPGLPVSLFQSRNVAKARIYGVELSGQYRFSSKPHGLSLLASLGWTVGDNLTTNEPLDSVEPFKAVVGLRYRAPENRWGADLIGSFVAQPRLSENRPAGSFTPSAYTVFDLIGFYNITPMISFNIGVFNLFNTEYFEYQDVRTLINAAAPRDLDRFAQPGTSVRAGLTYRF
ncbi:TonB-dependent hemoglobin/transferrin/lactoferrin family receptor [Leptolyngbya sp. AN03gr2]|uniref:TonB-dependent hemoglobin/transferrin/lactoferrin family receptor n=1 Tax=unclassified Leptolyngbya TaxID=2650499 RepID=UPI003D31EBF7